MRRWPGSSTRAVFVSDHSAHVECHTGDDMTTPERRAGRLSSPSWPDGWRAVRVGTVELPRLTARAPARADSGLMDTARAMDRAIAPAATASACRRLPRGCPHVAEHGKTLPGPLPQAGAPDAARGIRGLGSDRSLGDGGALSAAGRAGQAQRRARSKRRHPFPPTDSDTDPWCGGSQRSPSGRQLACRHTIQPGGDSLRRHFR